MSSCTVYVSCISLGVSYRSIKKGDSYYISRNVYPSNATNNTLNWFSSNSSVASVGNGVVTGNSAGTAIIYAEATDGSGVSASCTIEVTENIKVSSISVAPSTLNMKVGETSDLSETVYPHNATNKIVTWCSSNEAVATVIPSSGLVSAKKGGTAIIYANALDGSGVQGICTVTVRENILVHSITLSQNNLEMSVGATSRITACTLPTNATNRTIKWSSNNPSVVSVRGGNLTAHAVGEAAIYAKSSDGSGIIEYCCVKVTQHTAVEEEEKATSTTPIPETTVADPVDAYTGAHVLTNNLMTLFGGQGLKLTAHYNSTRLVSGLLGKGWYHNFEKRLVRSGYDILIYSNPSVYSKYVFDNQDCTTYTCTTPGKQGYLLTVDCEQQYPYSLNCNYEHTEYYSDDGYLMKIVDHQGFETLFSYTDTLITITDTVSGKKIYLEKDSSGKVIRVYDDAQRETTLTYTDNCITEICDVNNNKLKFTYNSDGQILTGTDSKDVCYFSNTYDSFGRVSQQRDGVTDSLPTIFCYTDNETRVITNRNGKQSTRKYNDKGLLESYTDENGNTKTYTYDDNYNVIKETFADRRSIQKVYNSLNKPTQITDKNGNKTYITYDSFGNVIRIQYPTDKGVITFESFKYNARNQLLEHVDTRGTKTEYTYDSAAMPKTKKVGSKNAVQYTYQNGLLMSQIDSNNNTTLYGHNALGQVTSVTDAKNRTTTYEYDNSGNLLKTIDANQKVILETVYDGNYQKTAVIDANGNKTEYTYNGNMKNTSIKYPDGNTVSFGYDGEDRIVSEKDQAGNITQFYYDDAGRMVAKYFPDGGTVHYEYDNVGNLLVETNPNCVETVKTYDPMGNVLTVTDGDGNLTRYRYNARGKVTSVVNAVAGTTVYEYSPAGDLLCEIDAVGNKKTYTYDAYGNKSSVTDAKGNTTSYTYDDNNNLLTVCDALGNVTTYTYDSLNQLETVKDARNNVITYGYDIHGKRTTVKDAKNNTFTTVYDDNGNVLRTEDAKGNTISETTYNNLNLPHIVTDSTGNTTTYTYNSLGKVAIAIDSMNNRKEYSYNFRGQNTYVKDANNGESCANYDTLGNVVGVAGPLGGGTVYTYDDMGRLISENTPSGVNVTYTYNALNVKEEVTNGREQKRKYFYDALGRVTGYIGVEDAVSYTYDANGNVLTVTDSNGTIKREYDALGRVVSYTDVYGKTVGYEYDEVGNLKKLTYPDGTAVNYTYDANNNLETVTDWAGRVTRYTYDVNNKVIGELKPDGSTTTTVYDNKQRIESYTVKAGDDTVITGFSFVYDTLGRITEETNLANNTKVCYTYDNLSRLLSRVTKNADGSVKRTENFTFDAAGNLTQTPYGNFTYDINNRFETLFVPNVSASYDRDGNLLSNGLFDFSYDSSNRLITAGGHSYKYDAENTRIYNSFNGWMYTEYTYNTNCRLSQLLEQRTNGVTTKYVYGLGLIGEELYGTFKTYHYDYRGSTVAITSACGEILDTLEYDAYGECIRHIGNTEVIFGYNGRDGVITERNDLLYMRARYFSKQVMRFVNADILHGDITDSQSLNRYAYVNGNPASFVDPLGLSKDDGRGNIDQDKLFEIFKKIKSQKDKKLASTLLASALDQLLSFKYVFSVEHEISLSFPAGINTYGNFSVTLSSGNGNIKISNELSEQMETLTSLSFDVSNVTVTFEGNGEINIEYSSNINEYTSVSAYVSGIPGFSLSAGYSISTSDNYNNSLSTSMGFTHLNSSNTNNIQKPYAVSVPIHEKQKSISEGYSWVDFGEELLAGLAVATGSTLIGYAAVNDATLIGIIDDLFLMPLGALLIRIGA